MDFLTSPRYDICRFFVVLFIAGLMVELEHYICIKLIGDTHPCLCDTAFFI